MAYFPMFAISILSWLSRSYNKTSRKKRFSITFPDIPSVYYRYVFFQFAVYCIAIAKPCLFLPRVRPLFAKPFLTGGLGPSLFVTFIAFGAFTHAFYLVRKASQVLKLLVDLWWSMSAIKLHSSENSQLAMFRDHPDYCYKTWRFLSCVLLSSQCRLSYSDHYYLSNPWVISLLMIPVIKHSSWEFTWNHLKSMRLLMIPFGNQS